MYADLHNSLEAKAFQNLPSQAILAKRIQLGLLVLQQSSCFGVHETQRLPDEGIACVTSYWQIFARLPFR